MASFTRQHWYRLCPFWYGISHANTVPFRTKTWKFLRNCKATGWIQILICNNCLVLRYVVTVVSLRNLSHSSSGRGSWNPLVHTFEGLKLSSVNNNDWLVIKICLRKIFCFQFYFRQKIDTKNILKISKKCYMFLWMSSFQNPLVHTDFIMFVNE